MRYRGYYNPMSHFALQRKIVGCYAGAHTFPLEKDLVQVLTGSINTLFAGIISNPKCLLEFEVGHRLADVALAAYAKDFKFEYFNLKNFPRLDSFDVAVVAHIMVRPLKSHTIARNLMASDELVTLRLRRLLKAGLIDSRGSTYFIGAWKEIFPRDMLFIEAKLDDWREAVNQAVQYKKYSELVYIAMPSKMSFHDEFMGICKEHGFGYISVSPRCGVHVVIPHRRTRVNSYLSNSIKLKFATSILRLTRDA